MSDLHVCRPQPDDMREVELICPTCGMLRKFLREHTPWYGTIDTCLACGDAWNGEGILMERPFAPGWRHASVRRAMERLKAFRARSPNVHGTCSGKEKSGEGGPT